MASHDARPRRSRSVVSSSPAATSIRSDRPCSISSASATAARASARLWETTTSPTCCSGRELPWLAAVHRCSLSFGQQVAQNGARSRPRAAAPRSSRRGPGDPRCARRGSWPGPCAPASAWSRPGPLRRRRSRLPARLPGSVRRPRAPRPARRRPAPARRTSSCPRRRPCRGRPLPRDRPAAPRRGRSPRPCSASPSEVPIRRKSVPNSGPLAPPTVETSVIPTLEKQRARRWPAGSRRARPRRPSCPGPCSTRGRRRRSPRRARSGGPGSPRRAAAKERTHCSRTAVVTLSLNGQMPHLNAAVLTGASQSESSSSSTLSRVTDAPAMSREVM